MYEEPEYGEVHKPSQLEILSKTETDEDLKLILGLVDERNIYGKEGFIVLADRMKLSYEGLCPVTKTSDARTVYEQYVKKYSQHAETLFLEKLDRDGCQFTINWPSDVYHLGTRVECRGYVIWTLNSEILAYRKSTIPLSLAARKPFFQSIGRG